ncbi:hypothetical protein [Aeoliella sp. SH292]|uniref:hypothetical protein n=1 Tax=Aeoliella sp. SH292 TaxID=3454464 RepID=UPI003F95AF32
MSARAVRLMCALLILLTFVAIPARSEEPATSTDVRHLELGDRYQVVVRRDDVEQRYSGELVQLTDEWLVLRFLSDPHPEPSLLVVSNPSKSIWGDVEERLGCTTYEGWIPRSVSTVVGRTLVADKTAFKRVTSDKPDWKSVQRVEFVAEGKSSRLTGTIRVENETVSCLTLSLFEHRTPWPMLGYIPGVGPLCTSSELELMENEHQIPLESILSFQVPTDCGWFPLAPLERTSFW